MPRTKTKEKTSPQAFRATLEGNPTNQQLVTAPAPKGEVDAVISAFERIALNPKADVKKMREIMDMKMELIRYNASIAYANALRDCQMEIEPVVRDAENGHTKSRYAKLEAIDNAIRKIYTKHGFSLSFDTSAVNHDYTRIYCDVWHTSGHKEKKQFEGKNDTTGPQGKSNKTQIQGVTSLTTTGRRILTCLIFNVVLTDKLMPDNDGNDAVPPGTEKAPDEFTQRVHAESKGKTIEGSAVPVGDEEEEWDGTLWHGKEKVAMPDASKNDVAFAAEQLKEYMRKYKTKKNRITLINSNLLLVKALVKANLGAVVGDLHKLADEGEDKI